MSRATVQSPAIVFRYYELVPDLCRFNARSGEPLSHGLAHAVEAAALDDDQGMVK